MRRNLSIILLCGVIVGLACGAAAAERGQIIGTLTGARSGIPVSVHPVVLMQGTEAIGRTLTDRLGKFTLDFGYTPGKPLTIKTGSTTGYLEAQGVVEPNTEVAIKIMPRWATVLGIVTDRNTGRGMADVAVRAGIGEELLPDTWSTVRTDATGVFMMKIPAFEGDDVTKPVRDLWLSINEGEAGNQAYAQIRTDSLPLWAWPDPTQPTKVEVSLPAADATGLTIADVVSIEAPEPLKKTLGAATPAPAAPTGEGPAAAGPAASAGEIVPGVFVWTCPVTGQKYRITIEPIE